jgi:tetratricopeptide (TPR) repeat protein
MKRDANRYVLLTDSAVTRFHAARRQLGLTMEAIVSNPDTPSANTVKKALRQEPVFVRTLERLWACLQTHATDQRTTFAALEETRDYVYAENDTLPVSPPVVPLSRRGWISRQVPHPNRLFTGRGEVLVRLHQALTSGPAALVPDPQALVGMGGMGKTQTAIAYIYQHRNEYERVFWVNAETLQAMNDGLASLADELALSPAPTPSRQLALEKVHAWFRDETDWLLVLDNADDLAQLAAHFPRHHGGHLLLTTRTRNTMRWAAPIPLLKFDRDEGALLLLRRAGRLGVQQRLEDVPAPLVESARELSDALDGLPLAINQAGAYLAESSATVVEYLTAYRQRGLELLEQASDPDHTSVTITFRLALEQMQSRAVFGPAAVELVYLCAFLMPDAIPEVVLSAYCSEQFDDIYAAFLTYSLATRNPENRTLTVHLLVQHSAQEALTPDEQRLWRQRAVHAVAEATPDFEYEDWALCDLLLPHWRLCARYIAEDGIETPQAAYLLYQAGRYLRARAAYDEADGFLREALALAEKVHGSTDRITADYLDEYACLYREMDRRDEAAALHRRSLEITEQVDGTDHPHTAAKLHNMALFYFQNQDFAQAETLFVRALGIWEQHPEVEPSFMAATLTQLAGVYRFQSLFDKAEPYSRRALHLYESTLGAEHIHVATASHNLGLLCVNLERYGEAESLFQRSLEINEAARGKEHPEIGSVLWGFAWCRWKQNRLPEADELFRRALVIYTKNYGPEHSQVTRLANSYTQFQRETSYSSSLKP